MSNWTERINKLRADLNKDVPEVVITFGLFDESRMFDSTVISPIGERITHTGLVGSETDERVEVWNGKEIGFKLDWMCLGWLDALCRFDSPAIEFDLEKVLVEMMNVGFTIVVKDDRVKKVMLCDYPTPTDTQGKVTPSYILDDMCCPKEGVGVFTKSLIYKGVCSDDRDDVMCFFWVRNDLTKETTYVLMPE